VLKAGVALVEAKQLDQNNKPTFKMQVIKVDISSGKILYDRLKEIQRSGATCPSAKRR
jgi:hypothetical protein